MHPTSRNFSGTKIPPTLKKFLLTLGIKILWMSLTQGTKQHDR
jgi:hypothetical protein